MANLAKLLCTIPWKADHLHNELIFLEKLMVLCKVMAIVLKELERDGKTEHMNVCISLLTVIDVWSIFFLMKESKNYKNHNV